MNLIFFDGSFCLILIRFELQIHVTLITWQPCSKITGITWVSSGAEITITTRAVQTEAEHRPSHLSPASLHLSFYHLPVVL